MTFLSFNTQQWQYQHIKQKLCCCYLNQTSSLQHDMRKYFLSCLEMDDIEEEIVQLVVLTPHDTQNLFYS